MESWLKKHFNFKKEEEFVIFMVWSVVAVTLFMAVLIQK